MLNEKALIVYLKISSWTGRKYDNRVSSSIEAKYEATDAGRYNKLLIDKDKINKIIKAAGKIRTFHYENTLPWGDGGERLLPSANYFNYLANINQLQSEFDKIVDDFIDNYSFYIMDSKIRLGNMFNLDDYPSKDTLREKFQVKLGMFPVPESDFRVEIPKEELTKLKQSMDAEVTERLEEATNHLWKRVEEKLVHLREKLLDTKAILKESLINNIKDLIDIVPKLNFSNNENIFYLIEHIKPLVVNSTESLRNNDDLRLQFGHKVDAILKLYQPKFS